MFKTNIIKTVIIATTFGSLTTCAASLPELPKKRVQLPSATPQMSPAMQQSMVDKAAESIINSAAVLGAVGAGAAIPTLTLVANQILQNEYYKYNKKTRHNIMLNAQTAFIISYILILSGYLASKGISSIAGSQNPYAKLLNYLLNAIFKIEGVDKFRELVNDIVQYHKNMALSAHENKKPLKKAF